MKYVYARTKNRLCTVWMSPKTNLLCSKFTLSEPFAIIQYNTVLQLSNSIIRENNCFRADIMVIVRSLYGCSEMALFKCISYTNINVIIIIIMYFIRRFSGINFYTIARISLWVHACKILVEIRKGPNRRQSFVFLQNDMRVNKQCLLVS